MRFSLQDLKTHHRCECRVICVAVEKWNMILVVLHLTKGSNVATQLLALLPQHDWNFILKYPHIANPCGIVVHSWQMLKGKQTGVLLLLVSLAGGWPLVGINSSLAGINSSTPWDLNGEQFGQEKLLNSRAFFTMTVYFDPRKSSRYIIKVSLSLHTV